MLGYQFIRAIGTWPGQRSPLQAMLYTSPSSPKWSQVKINLDQNIPQFGPLTSSKRRGFTMSLGSVLQACRAHCLPLPTPLCSALRRDENGSRGESEQARRRRMLSSFPPGRFLKPLPRCDGRIPVTGPHLLVLPPNGPWAPYPGCPGSALNYAVKSINLF